MYTETIRRWAADTRYVGTLDDPSGIGEVGLNPQQAGRQVAVRFALRLQRQRVASVRYQVFGCGYSIAACAAAAELAANHSLKEVRAITPERIDTLLEGLPEDRKYCADLAFQALQAALDSTAGKAAVVRQALDRGKEPPHGPRVTASDPLYRALRNSPAPADVTEDDRHLFVCLLTVANQEGDSGRALGLKDTDLQRLRRRVFPRFDLTSVKAQPRGTDLSKADPEVRELLPS